MKILVLSFYFPPDLSAGSFRARAVVEALQQELPAGSEVDVITTLPNRYHSFTVEAPAVETRAGVRIRRIALSRHKSGVVDQSSTFVTFARSTLRHARNEGYDLVFATSSRLMTAVLGVRIARHGGSRCYLDIRDLFVANLRHIAPHGMAWLLKPVFAAVERWAISRADRVNLVSPGFAGYFEPRYPKKRFAYFTNGVDKEFVAAGERLGMQEPTGARTPLEVVYAGNVGEGQGLHTMLPALATRMGDGVRFKVIGDGGRMPALRSALSAADVRNVEILPPVERDVLLDVYERAQVLFLHLNDYEAFRHVLPSKLFEYAALGKPLWAGVAGYPAEFIRSEISNAAVFEPCNVDAAVLAFQTLELRDRPRTEFVAKYHRSAIAAAMARDIVTVAAG